MENLSIEIFIWMLTVSALIMLLFYNSVIYLYSRIKSFLFYAIYNFFLVIYIGSKTGLYSLYPGMVAVHQDNWYIQIIYNLAYVQFFRYFLDLKDHAFSLDLFLKRFIYISFPLSSILFFLFLFTGRLEWFRLYFLYIFLPIILSVAVYSILKVIHLRNNLKYYVIFGASTYIILGIIAIYFSESKQHLMGADPIVFFYIGVLLETVLFSMGLGHKVKIISAERILTKQLLIKQLQENDRIKEERNKDLSREVKLKTDELIQALKEKEREKIERIQLEYEQKINELNLISLRNQMNPHFIFNALNAIKAAIISERKKDAISYLNKFSKLLREILRFSDEDNYTLERELNTLKLYVGLENIRHTQKIDLTIELEKDLNPQAYHIPILLLQPLIENAIWHGLSAITGRQKRITITLSQKIKNRSLYIEIEDNGIGLIMARQIKEQKVFLRESLGIKLVEERLKLFAQKVGVGYEVRLFDLCEMDPGSSGTRVGLIVPIEKIE